MYPYDDRQQLGRVRPPLQLHFFRLLRRSYLASSIYQDLSFHLDYVYSMVHGAPVVLDRIEQQREQESTELIRSRISLDQSQGCGL